MKRSLFSIYSFILAISVLMSPGLVLAASECMTPPNTSLFCPIPYLAASDCTTSCGSTQNCCQPATCPETCTAYDSSGVQGCSSGLQVDTRGACGGGEVCCMAASSSSSIPTSTPTVTPSPTIEQGAPLTCPTPGQNLVGGVCVTPAVVPTSASTGTNSTTSAPVSINPCEDPSLQGVIAVCASGQTAAYPIPSNIKCKNSPKYYCYVNILMAP